VAALALVAGGVDVQGVAGGERLAQGGTSLKVEALQVDEEAIAERTDGARGDGHAAVLEHGLGLLALLPFEVAREAGEDDQVVAELLARRDEPSDLVGSYGGTPGSALGLAPVAAELPLSGDEGPQRERGHGAGVGLVDPERLSTGRTRSRRGDEVYLRQRSARFRQGPTDLLGVPPGARGVQAEPVQ